MTLNVEVNENKTRIQYIADGENKMFDFPFKIFNPKDLVVYFGDTVQSSDLYSVEIDSENQNGSILFATAPTAGTRITLSRELSIERTTYFQEQLAIRPKTLNQELDYQIACTQQLADAVNRTMILPVYSNDKNISMVLPEPQAGKAILWSSDGTKLENSSIEINNLTSQMQSLVEQATTSAQIATEKANIAAEALENITIPIPSSSDSGKFLTTDGSISSWATVPPPAELANKANTDLSNVSSNLDYVVESYQNGTDWYKIYKSGFVEQGGVSSTGTTVNFLKAFANTNYSITGNEKLSNQTNPWANTSFKAMNCTVSGFYCYLSNTNNQNNISTTVSWRACGQGATE